MTQLSLQTAVKAIALERIMHYRVRLDARNAIPVGAKIPFDLTARLHGLLVHEAGTTEPAADTLLCPAVVAAAAAALGIKPADLTAALSAAAADLIVKGQFVGRDIVDEDDPHVMAIAAVDDALIPLLKEKPRNGALKVSGQITWHKSSTIDGRTLDPPKRKPSASPNRRRRSPVGRRLYEGKP